MSDPVTDPIVTDPIVTAPVVTEADVASGVVAAFDGSAGGARVLEWAVREAAAHGEPLHVVRAWTLAGAADEAGAPFGVVPSLRECQDAVAEGTRRRVASARRTAGSPDVEVHVHAVHGAAGPVLEAAARHARVVVVGHRGRGRLQLVLGSVTEHLLARAACPVTVVRL